MLHLVLRKYKEVYDENFAGCQWRVESSSNWTSLNDGMGTTGHRRNGREMAGHDRLNIFGDAEVGHKETPRDVSDWTKSRTGYTLGDIKLYGKHERERKFRWSKGYQAHAKAGTGVDFGEGSSLDLGVGAETNVKISSDHIDVGVGVGAGYVARAVAGGPSFGLGITSGVGVSGGFNEEEVNIGGSVLTPVGTFGAHVGCNNKICIFGCFTIDFC